MRASRLKPASSRGDDLLSTTELDAGSRTAAAPVGERGSNAPVVLGVARFVAVRVAALAIFVLAWQIVVWTGWKPQYLIPSPFTVLDATLNHPGAFAHDAGVTIARASVGLGAALVLGVVVGVLGAVAGPLRAPLRSVVAGLSTLPAVVWYPAVLIAVGPSTAVLVFAMVVGATPPIARGVIDGVTGTRGRRGPEGPAGRGRVAPTRTVVLGAMPDLVLGTRTGWSACWGVLLAGEIILTLPSLGLGGQLVVQRGLNDTVAVYQLMIVIFVLGVLVDGAVFGTATALLGRRRDQARAQVPEVP